MLFSASDGAPLSLASFIPNPQLFMNSWASVNFGQSNSEPIYMTDADRKELLQILVRYLCIRVIHPLDKKERFCFFSISFAVHPKRYFSFGTTFHFTVCAFILCGVARLGLTFFFFFFWCRSAKVGPRTEKLRNFDVRTSVCAKNLSI